MADAITIKALQDASLDAKSLEDVVNGDEAKQITTRKGETYPSVKKAIKTLFENGGLPATPFATKALMTASALADGKYAQVTDDTVNNGLYVKTGGAWVKSSYDIAEMIKLETNKLNSLTVNKGGLYPFIYEKRGSVAYNGAVDIFEKNILSITVNNAEPDFYYRLGYVMHRPDNNPPDAGADGWQFERISKSDYKANTDGTRTVLTLAPDVKFKIVANSGIARFTLQAKDSDESFDVVINTNDVGFSSNVEHLGTGSSRSAYQHIIDPNFYKLKNNKDSLSINKGKLYPFITKKRGTYNLKGALTLLEKNILDITVNNALPNTYYRISYMNHSPDTVPPESGLNGWQIRSINKTTYETSNTLGTVLTDIDATKHEIVPNTGIDNFRLKIPNSDLSFDITLDTTGFVGNQVHAQNRATLVGFDHIIDPSKYRYKDDSLVPTPTASDIDTFLSKEILLDKPTFDALSYGVLPISSGGTPDYDNIVSGHNLTHTMYPASLTKVMTALLAVESSLGDASLLTVQTGDLLGGELKAGDVITLKDALHYLLLPSSNTTAMVIARTVGELTGGNRATFVAAMNAKAAALGMTNTVFKNPHGLEDTGQYSCVADLFKLGYAASQIKRIRDVWSKKTYEVTVTGVNARTFNAVTSFAVVGGNYWCLGGKTGTNLGVYNIMIHVQLQNGYKGIAITLGGNGDAQRISDITNLVNYARNSYSYPSPATII